MIIKVRLEGVWPEELPAVLWAYLMPARTPIGETPFKLTFGIEVVIPMDVSLSNLRREPFDDETNDKSHKLDLDCFDEVREDALWRMTKHKQKMTKYHDQRVKLKRFNHGDKVLHRVTEATKDLTKENLT